MAEPGRRQAICGSGRVSVAKPEWGVKRICPSCGARYYDLHRDPIICPKCGTQYDPEVLLKTRRKAPVQPVEPEVVKKVPVPAVEPEAEPEEAETPEGETPVEGTEEEEEEEVIEDASELGEDEDDMAEVIDNVEEEEP